MINFKDQKPYSQQTIDEHKYLIETVGYNAFPGFFSEEVCEYLKERLFKAVNEYKPLGSDRSIKDQFHLHDLMCRDIVFLELLEDPRLQQIAASILGDHWIMYAFTSSSLPPHGKNYGSRLHVDSPRLIPGYHSNFGFLWALDDFTLENGATKLLAASHHSATAPSEEFFEKNCVRAVCKKGTLLAFSPRLWHRAGENNSDNWRHSLTMNLCRPYMKQRMDWVRFIPKELADKVNGQARRIIGYDTRLPSNLEEFFVSDDKRLYKANQE